MAVMKMPEGAKRSRSKDYSGVHNIAVDGEHAGTIIGHKNNDRHAPAHSKYYEVHTNEHEAVHGRPYDLKKLQKGYGHPLHQVTKMAPYTKPGKNGDVEYHEMEHKAPKRYGSMDEAIHHVTSAHRNEKEFGAGHNKEDRWAHAVSKLHEVKAHADIANHHEAAIRSLAAAGHHDLAQTVSDRLDAHKAAAAGKATTKAKIKQWLHDAPSHVAGYRQEEGPHHAAALTAVRAAEQAGVHSPHLPW